MDNIFDDNYPDIDHSFPSIPNYIHGVREAFYSWIEMELLLLRPDFQITVREYLDRLPDSDLRTMMNQEARIVVNSVIEKVLNL